MALASGAGFAAIVLLILNFGVTPAEILSALLAAPVQLYVVVAAITFLNILAGALKWRLSLQALSLGKRDVPLREGIEATAFGALFGQVMPVQITTAVTRAIYGPRFSVSPRAAVLSTIHEQIYDLLPLIAMSLCGTVIVMRGSAEPVDLAIFSAALVSGFAILTAGSRIAARAGHAAPRMLRVRLLEPMERVAAIPGRVSGMLAALGVCRLLLGISRALLVAWFFAPAASLAMVAAGFPLAGWAGSLPITPAGIGVVEWSWAGILLMAGASGEEAAIASVSFRIVNFVALLIVLAALTLSRLASLSLLRR